MKLVLSVALVILSGLLLGAHFLRSGQYVWVGASLAAPLLLLLRRAWAIRVVQAGLLTAAGIWIATVVETASRRLDAGQPWFRMALILGSVSLLAVAGAGLLQVPDVRRKLASPRRGPGTPEDRVGCEHPSDFRSRGRGTGDAAP